MISKMHFDFYTETLELSGLCLSLFHVDMADTLRSIGLVAKELQLYDKSLSVLTEALSIYQNSMRQNDSVKEGGREIQGG